jgi:hypothetical protein
MPLLADRSLAGKAEYHADAGNVCPSRILDESIDCGAMPSDMERGGSDIHTPWSAMASSASESRQPAGAFRYVVSDRDVVDLWPARSPQLMPYQALQRTQPAASLSGMIDLDCSPGRAAEVGIGSEGIMTPEDVARALAVGPSHSDVVEICGLAGAPGHVRTTSLHEGDRACVAFEPWRMDEGVLYFWASFPSLDAMVICIESFLCSPIGLHVRDRSPRPRGPVPTVPSRSGACRPARPGPRAPPP